MELGTWRGWLQGVFYEPIERVTMGLCYGQGGGRGSGGGGQGLISNITIFIDHDIHSY